MNAFAQELREQPDALRRCIAAYEADPALLDALPAAAQPVLVGMGASYHASLIASAYAHSLNIPALALESADALNYGGALLTTGRPLVFVSQSGKSAEVAPTLRLMPDGWDDPVYLLVLDSGGFAAVSSICTHRGCTVDPGGPGLACPCHGSQYDREGQVVRGPASRALERYPVRSSGDELIIEVGAPR